MVFAVFLVMVINAGIVILKKSMVVYLVRNLVGIIMQINKYDTRMVDGVWLCDCPHFKFRGTYCRHILQKLLDLRGKVDGVRDTSIEAYIGIISDPSSLNDRYQDILIAISEIGMPSSDYEIASHMGFDDPNKVRPRRYELVYGFFKPFLEEKGKRICKKTGKTVFTWGLTRQGELLVDDLQKVLS